VGNDLRDIEAAPPTGDERCRMAHPGVRHRVRKYIGAYAAVMGGVDVVVFTAGIGENSASCATARCSGWSFSARASTRTATATLA
jgi:acetate kinase